MQISQKGIELIQDLEAREGVPMLKAYKDTGGVPTIGWGHTATAEDGMEITFEEATALLADDVTYAEETVRRLVRPDLAQHEFDALVSFVFNIGETQFRKSTMLAKLNAGDKEGAGREFTRWIYDDGRVINGLVYRRFREWAAFQGYPY